MKVNWHPNPIKTCIELDSTGRLLLASRLEFEKLSDAAIYFLEKDRFGDTESQCVKRLNDAFDFEATEDIISQYEDYLSEPHLGDCICAAMSCFKCYSENLLGISTIEEFPQAELRYIKSYFDAPDEPSIGKVIERLLRYETKERDGVWLRFTQEEYDFHAKRWQREHENAARLLLDYKEKHGF